MNKFKILVTNDDGYEAKGLLCLVEALRELENVEVTVVAPANEKSACGHSLTLVRPLRFVSVGDDFYKLDDGTPTDCVYLSLSTMFENDKPDLLVSGINRGSNMGEDITYSGTAAGAMEGVLHDVPSIAISQVMDFTNPDGDFSLAQKTIKKLVSKIREGEFPLPDREFINVNIPPEKQDAQMRVTYAGYRHYGNDSHLHRNPRGEEYHWLGLHPLSFASRSGAEGLSDYESIEQGYISVTPIMLDLSAYKSMKSLEAWIDQVGVYDRIELLLGDDFVKLEDANIILLGVGGVGSFCLDCLYRSGIKNITIVDFDTYDDSNQNRQMWSELHEGEVKVEALKRHYPELKIINKRIDEQWVWDFDFDEFDLVLDAIDDRNAKLALAQKCYKKLISSFGGAKRMDPTKIKVDDIWKSYGDKFGSKIRYELKKRGFKKKYKVIFSSEEANIKEKGSFMGVTATFGLTMCGEAIKKLRGKK